MNNYKSLEFDIILQMLSDCALSAAAKERCLALPQATSADEADRLINETTQAKTIMEFAGTPPLSAHLELHMALGMISVHSILTPAQITNVASFLSTCRRIKLYLKKAEQTGVDVALYGNSIHDLSELENEIEKCIRNDSVDDRASTELADVRRRIVITGEQIKAKLNELLRKNKDWFSDSFISVRNGRHTLPVKREHKNDISGTLIDMSQSGSTCFIEPASARKLHEELSLLYIREENEIRRILYELTALIQDYTPLIKLNIEAMETLDFLFAKAKLSISMHANSVSVTNNRRIKILNGRHPLLKKEIAVPLDFEVGGQIKGIIITGPNTGGKTVALKTVGLLSLMAQSGLHVPADENSVFSINNMVVCDIGDGQSITENLSTFSSHMTNIIQILNAADSNSLVLLDELGSGTDPAEGMGIAVAVLEELCAINCLFVATTHYPEIKEYAGSRPGLMNAKMTFDRESLKPLYQLEIGRAGESCAIYIAQRLGMPSHMLELARGVAYGGKDKAVETAVTAKSVIQKQKVTPELDERKQISHTPQNRGSLFNIGDSVIVYPQKEIGIVCAKMNEKGELGVQVKKRKLLVNYKRVKLKVAAAELYPDNYDFSIVFDSVANRKARHIMEKRHEEGNIVKY